VSLPTALIVPASSPVFSNDALSTCVPVGIGVADVIVCRRSPSQL
jgi:hypothetical protein